MRKHGILKDETHINLIPFQAALKATKKLGENKDSRPSTSSENHGINGCSNEQLRPIDIINGFQLCPPETNRGIKNKTIDRRQSNDTTTSIEAEEKIEQNLGFVFSDAYIPIISHLVERTVIKVYF